METENNYVVTLNYDEDFVPTFSKKQAIEIAENCLKSDLVKLAEVMCSPVDGSDDRVVWKKGELNPDKRSVLAPRVHVIQTDPRNNPTDVVVTLA